MNIQIYYLNTQVATVTFICLIIKLLHADRVKYIEMENSAVGETFFPAVQQISYRSRTGCVAACMGSNCPGVSMKTTDTGLECVLSVFPWTLQAGDWLTIVRNDIETPPEIKTLVRRLDGSVDFNKNWADYKNGFGSEDGEYWLGLETAHQLTTTWTCGLRVDFTYYNGTKRHAEYSSFSIGPESDKYRLTFSGFDPSSTAGDLLDGKPLGTPPANNVQNMQFTTADSQNDNCGGWNCAWDNGGWWYNCCASGKPTGLYRSSAEISHHYATWDGMIAVKYIELRIVPYA